MTEREGIIERLRDIRKDEINLSRICKTIIDKHDVLWTIEEFLELRDKLIDLLSTGRKDEQTPAMLSDERITDELRKWLDQYTMRKDTYDEMITIIDRIDAAHEEALSQAYMNLSDSKWILLPKDIDDKPINEHDKVDWRDCSGTWHKNALVVAVCSDGCYVMDDGMVLVHKSNIRHHRVPTVEDVLRDMHAKLDEVTALYVGEAIDADERNHDEARIIAEYAAKLRLAGDAE